MSRFFIGCCLAVLVSGTVFAEELVNRIVAVVNGEIVTLFEVDQQLQPLMEQQKRKGAQQPSEEQIATLRQNVVNLIVDNILLRQEAEKLGMEVSNVELQNRIRQVREQNQMTEEQFNQTLKLRGLTRQEYEKQLREEILRHKLLGYMVRNKVVVTDQEIEEYYQEHKQEFERPREVSLRIIVLPPGTDDTSLRDEIISGSLSFEEAAQTFSQGPGADQGGSLGTFQWKDLSDELRSVLKEMEPGNVSEPFTFQGSQALLQLESVTGGKGASLDGVRDQIYDRLYRPQLEERLAEYIEKLRGKAVIDIRL